MTAPAAQVRRRDRPRAPGLGLSEPVVDYLVLVGVLGLSFAVPGLRSPIAALLVFVALAGPSWALRALTLSWLITVLNPGIVGDGGVGAGLRYMLALAVFASAAFRGLWTTRGRVPGLVVQSLAFPAYAAVAAVGVSYALDISLLKVLAYTIGAAGILWSAHLDTDSERLRRWMIRLVAVIVFASFPLITAGVGYHRNGTGFQGILTHPQFYGAFLGVVLAWLYALRFIEHDRSRIVLATLVVGFVSLVATEARVGAATLIGTAVFVSLFFAPSGWQRRRARNFLLALITVLLLLLLLFPAIGEAIYQFAIKEGRGNPQDLAESLELSRGALIAASFANFLEHPLVGIGFGLPSEPFLLDVRRDPVLGLPTGAPIEKGFIVTALLEETGIIGFALFGLFVAALIRRALWSRRASFIALAVAVPISNMAEVTMFSIGGNGLLFWVLMGFAAYGARPSWHEPADDAGAGASAVARPAGATVGATASRRPPGRTGGGASAA